MWVHIELRRKNTWECAGGKSQGRPQQFKTQIPRGALKRQQSKKYELLSNK